MAKTPFFSIVIPALNEEKDLPNLLKDLQKQTFQDFDVWVVDGNSEDKTAEVAEKFAAINPHFHVLRTPIRNVGHQRNLGAEKSRGKYILFLDADNRLPQGYLTELSARCIKKNAQAFTTWSKPDSKSLQDRVVMFTLNLGLSIGAKIRLPATFGSCIGCERSVFQQSDGFNASLVFMEDVDFIQRLVKKGFRFTVFRRPQYSYSFRRMRKEGSWRLYGRVAPYILQKILRKKHNHPLDVYPMHGGGYFRKKI